MNNYRINNCRIHKLLHRKKKERGVAIIFFALVFGLFLAFFLVILNTGTMVWQKMRLQMAVDLASYAGASVQASYLGNSSSAEQSIMALNAKIMARYGKLTKDLQFGTIAPWPGIMAADAPITNVGLCMALCQAASLANAQYAVGKYKEAAADIEEMRNGIIQILANMQKSSRLAAEQTISLNIPSLKIEGDDIGALLSDTTNDAKAMIESAKANYAASQNFGVKKKNAILSFSSKKGFYLANVVASVPHAFAYFGPTCWNLYTGTQYESWYCSVNGVGAPGGAQGWQEAYQAFAKTKLPIMNGNVGNIEKIADKSAHALRLNFILNPKKPEPFMAVAAEWNPPNGSFINLENAFGINGSLFPKQTKLMAVSVAEPFGGDLISQEPQPFGARLQGIRKVLLDPRLQAVKTDYPNMFDYFQSLGPRDSAGRVTVSSEEVIRRFLH